MSEVSNWDGEKGFGFIKVDGGGDKDLLRGRKTTQGVKEGDVSPKQGIRKASASRHNKFKQFRSGRHEISESGYVSVCKLSMRGLRACTGFRPV